MNIFVTHHDPVVCAEYLDDKRVCKMIVESTQMLSAARLYYGLTAPYKMTHANHPCTVWVRTNKSNYRWLLTHLTALLHEYEKRYSRVHKCKQYLPLLCMIEGQDSSLPDGARTQFVNCTPYKALDTIEAYRITLCEKWLNDKYPPRRYRQLMHIGD